MNDSWSGRSGFPPAYLDRVGSSFTDFLAATTIVPTAAERAEAETRRANANFLKARVAVRDEASGQDIFSLPCRCGRDTTRM